MKKLNFFSFVVRILIEINWEILNFFFYFEEKYFFEAPAFLAWGYFRLRASFECGLHSLKKLNLSVFVKKAKTESNTRVLLTVEDCRPVTRILQILDNHLAKLLIALNFLVFALDIRFIIRTLERFWKNRENTRF